MEYLRRYKKGAIVIGVLLYIFIWWGSAKAEGLYIDVGPSQIAGHFTDAIHLQLSNRYSKHIDLGIGYIGPQNFRNFDIQEQIYAGVEFVVSDPWVGKARIGFGPYVFQNADRAVTSKFRICASLEYAFTKRIGAKARHCSNAGSGTEIEICDRNGDCFTNDWNTGQDSWARLIWYF
jgi:hypothetical protein